MARSQLTLVRTDAAEPSITVVNTNETDADRKWGYRFGCEGLRTLEEAAEILRCCVRTVERRAVARLIRVGLHGGRTVVCLRSLMDYIASLEK